MIRVAVAGVAGRMGSRIAQLVGETEGIELVGGFERPDHPAVGRELAECIGGTGTGLRVSGSIAEVLKGADVVIDFTSASASCAHLETAASAGKPMVIGSTGFSSEQLQKARELTRNIACVLAPNMSMGVNVLFKIVADVARMLGDGGEDRADPSGPQPRQFRTGRASGRGVGGEPAARALRYAECARHQVTCETRRWALGKRNWKPEPGKTAP